jgi:hypothetical protein
MRPSGGGGGRRGPARGSFGNPGRGRHARDRPGDWSRTRRLGGWSGDREPGHASPSPATAGKRDDEPHGREWMRQSTESGGDQAAKVARNGAGGTARVWKPVTRRGVGGPEQSGTSRQLPRYSSAQRSGLAGRRIPRIERVGGATNPRGEDDGTSTAVARRVPGRHRSCGRGPRGCVSGHEWRVTRSGNWPDRPLPGRRRRSG